MDQFIGNYWGVIVAALLIVIGLLWLLRGRNGKLPDDQGIDLPPASDDSDHDEAAGAAAIAASHGATPIVPPTQEGSENTAVAKKAPMADLAEPAAPIAPPVAEPSASPDIPPAVGDADNLQLMKGVGPKLAARLTEMGITRFDQIAAWTENDIAEVDAQLGTFAGRIRRDNWVEQAGLLASGDRAGFEAKYGALGADLTRR